MFNCPLNHINYLLLLFQGEADNMKFIDFSMEIIGNFCFLVLSTPEIFEAQSFEKEIAHENDCNLTILN